MLYDLDGHDYVDYVMSWGPLILGHAHPAVRAPSPRPRARHVVRHADRAESELAELVISMVPSIARMRFVSSGTEATIARCGWRAASPAARRS